MRPGGVHWDRRAFPCCISAPSSGFDLRLRLHPFGSRPYAVTERRSAHAPFPSTTGLSAPLPATLNCARSVLEHCPSHRKGKGFPREDRDFAIGLDSKILHLRCRDFARPARGLDPIVPRGRDASPFRALPNGKAETFWTITSRFPARQGILGSIVRCVQALQERIYS